MTDSEKPSDDTRPKSIHELLQAAILNAEDPLWCIQEIEAHPYFHDLNDSEKDDLQTAKELLESGRDLVLTILRRFTKRGRNE